VAELTVGHRDEPLGVAAVAEAFAALHPGYRLGYATLESDSPRTLTADGGALLLWVDRGGGGVWLEGGYRANEGDGLALPPQYVADPLEGANRQALEELARGLDTAHPGVAAPLRAIVERYDGWVYRGEMAGDVWRLLESGLPPDAWVTGATARAALDHLLARGRALGWSTKHGAGSFERFAAGDHLLARGRALGWSTKHGAGSFERFAAGDQLLVRPDTPLTVQGTCGYWWLAMPPGVAPPGPAVRRLRYLKDTAGGCAPGFDAFRRLPLTWQSYTGTPGQPDGLNVVNSHVVNIAAEQSRTHYHPVPPVGGGAPQTEFYFVLDPADFSLGQAGRHSFLHAFPDIAEWARVTVVPLRPGTVALIPPGTGHRGLDALVNVVTVPGFKPRNEIYADALIAAHTGGRGAFNLAFAEPAGAVGRA